MLIKNLMSKLLYFSGEDDSSDWEKGGGNIDVNKPNVDEKQKEYFGDKPISRGGGITSTYDWKKRLVPINNVHLIKENPNSYLIGPGPDSNLRGTFNATKKYSVLIRPLEEDETSLYDIYVPERLYNELYRVDPLNAKTAQIVDESYTDQVETHYDCGCIYYKEKDETKHPSSWFDYCERYQIPNRKHGINI